MIQRKLSQDKIDNKRIKMMTKLSKTNPIKNKIKKRQVVNFFLI